MALYDPVPNVPSAVEVDLCSAAERLGITEKQAGSLYALAQGLLALPEGYQHFDMRYYFKDPDGDGVVGPPVVVPDPVACGTCACALGHAPYVLGVPSLPKEPWTAYGERVLGLSCFGQHELLWRYLFSHLWFSRDNTAHGAGRRILRALRRGTPEEYDPDYCDVCTDYLLEPLP